MAKEEEKRDFSGTARARLYTLAPVPLVQMKQFGVMTTTELSIPAHSGTVHTDADPPTPPVLMEYKPTRLLPKHRHTDTVFFEGGKKRKRKEQEHLLCPFWRAPEDNLRT